MSDAVTPWAALGAGLVTSLHCVGMCGPLACAACASPCAREALRASLAYHASRVSSFAALGLAAGWLGERVAGVLTQGGTRGMAWIFALFFLAVAAGLDKRFKVPALATPWASRFLNMRFSPVQRGAMLGLVTPLLPCAPLYLMVAAAALAGSPWNGALVMGLFGFGTVPLMLGAMGGLAALEARWGPGAVEWLRRGLALVGAGLLIARGFYHGPESCPMCH